MLTLDHWIWFSDVIPPPLAWLRVQGLGSLEGLFTAVSGNERVNISVIFIAMSIAIVGKFLHAVMRIPREFHIFKSE